MEQREDTQKIVLIIRRTRLDELVRRFNTEDQARFYVEHLGADFADYKAEDQTYRQAVRSAETALGRCGRVHVVERSFLPNYLFGPRDLVVALGQDGLVANVLKYLDGQVLIGVNPDRARFEGILLPFDVSDLERIVPEVFAERRPIADVTMAEAKLNTGETLAAVNDLFIGPRSHTSARYTIQFGERTERHSSSGIIVSTGLGSTGWFRSVVAGATGVASALTGTDLQIDDERRSLSWNADQLFFSVREPWPSNQSGAGITFGTVTPAAPLVLVSQMAEHGVIFSDGMESDFIRFNSGTEAVIGIAAKKGHLVT